jgi:transcriptional regulator with XRE-family HTH domain
MERWLVVVTLEERRKSSKMARKTDEGARQRGLRIRRLREQRNWSGVELARRMRAAGADPRVTENWVYMIERGEIGDPGGTRLSVLARVYGVSDEYLRGLDPQPEPGYDALLRRVADMVPARVPVYRSLWPLTGGGMGQRAELIGHANLDSDAAALAKRPALWPVPAGQELRGCPAGARVYVDVELRQTLRPGEVGVVRYGEQDLLVEAVRTEQGVVYRTAEGLELSPLDVYVEGVVPPRAEAYAFWPAPVALSPPAVEAGFDGG